MAMALPALAAGGEAALTALGTAAPYINAAMGVDFLGRKYGSKLKGLANNVLNIRGKAKSAKHYIKKLGTGKGLKKFVTKDIPKAAKKASKFIESGKLLEGVRDVAADIGTVGNIASSLGHEELGKNISNIGSQVQSTGEHYHDVLNQYNEAGKEAVHQFKERRKAPIQQ